MPAWAGARGRAVVLAVVLLVGVALVADATASVGVGAAGGANAVESTTPNAPGKPGNSTQGQSATLRIQVTMGDSSGGPLAPPACEDGAVDTASDPGRPAALAHTGAAPPAAALALGALAAGIGLALLGRRRRGIDGER